MLYWKLTQNAVLIDAALACAAALVANISPGNATHSPWPFRVYAETGTVREGYVAPVALHLGTTPWRHPLVPPQHCTLALHPSIAP